MICLEPYVPTKWPKKAFSDNDHIEIRHVAAMATFAVTMRVFFFFFGDRMETRINARFNLLGTGQGRS